MKTLFAIVFTLTLSTAFAGSLLNNTNFFRLDVDSNEIDVYVPDGHCTVQIISNHSALHDSTQSSSPVGPALRDALEINDGKIDFVKHRLTVDLTKAHHGGFGSIVRIKTKSGRTLKDVIHEIIPDVNDEESTVILTLIGNDSNERHCSFQ